MGRVGSVCLMSFLLALLTVLGLDVYTARHPELDESGLLSSVDRITRIVPSGTRLEILKEHSLHHQTVVGAGLDSMLKANRAGLVGPGRKALQPTADPPGLSRHDARPLAPQGPRARLPPTGGCRR